jgi:hypothetical protein
MDLPSDTITMPTFDAIQLKLAGAETNFVSAG